MTDEVAREVEQLSKEMIDSLELPRKRLKPMVLMLGGFQGSGKTTVVNELKDDLDLVLLSTDEIRQRLFDKKYALSKKFREIVVTTTYKVLENLLELGYSVALDRMATPARIEKVRKLLGRKNLSNYSLVTVYLEASQQELVRRLNTREDVIGRYKGTVNELEASMRQHGKIEKSIYDVVINTKELDLKTVAKVIKKKTKSLEL